jgi:hypothetical protein
VPQGCAKKIEIELLLADLPLQLGYAGPRLHKIGRFLRRPDRRPSRVMAGAA